MVKRQRTQRELYDRLQKLKDSENGSYWAGDRGIYYIELKDRPEADSRIGFVSVGHKYLTGLFLAERPQNGLLYVGDTGGYFLLFMETEVGIDIYRGIRKKAGVSHARK